MMDVFVGGGKGRKLGCYFRLKDWRKGMENSILSVLQDTKIQNLKKMYKCCKSAVFVFWIDS